MGPEKIVFLPFAGGSRYSYRSIIRNLPNNLRPVVVELPGRGLRGSEKFLTTISESVEDLFAQLKNEINGDYLIFGHSMGALLGYLLSKRIFDSGMQMPRFLICSGSPGPSKVCREKKNMHLKNSDIFWREMNEYGGVPEEVFKEKSLREVLEPILRADFQILQTYSPGIIEKPYFSTPILILTGEDEDIVELDALAWKEITEGIFLYKKFPGNHFFIFKNEIKLINEIMNFYSVVINS
jgi:medium-chain acyl-[acyl-carrier-protein] hydrolase